MGSTLSLTSSNNAALTRGADYSFGLSLADATGTAISMTNYTASIVLLRAPGGDLVATFSPTVTSSLITASLSHTVTAALPLPIADASGLRSYWVKILLTRPDGSVISGGEGPLEILP